MKSNRCRRLDTMSTATGVVSWHRSSTNKEEPAAHCRTQAFPNRAHPPLSISLQLQTTSTMPIASVFCSGASRENSVLRTVGLLLLLAGPWGLSSGLRLEGGPWEVQRRDGGEETSLPWLDRAMEALESATRFFENNYDRIILDGIFGLRVAEGKISAFICYHLYRLYCY